MSETPTQKTPLILIVDSDRATRSLLNSAMLEAGYRVIEAGSGEQCLSKYTHFQPDLILLEAIMPDLDGFTCCQKIRSLPGGDRVPILMITELDDQESVEQTFKAEATDYIPKPINWSVLSQRVGRLLANNQTGSELAAFQAQLSQQRAWEELLNQILEKLTAKENIDDSTEQVLTMIREWLQATRILFSQSNSRYLWEAVAMGFPSIQNFLTTDFNLVSQYGEQYQQGKTIIIENIFQANLPLTLVEQLQQLNTKALALVPIKKGHQLGILAIHFSGMFPQDQLLLSRLSALGKLLALAIL